MALQPLVLFLHLLGADYWRLVHRRGPTAASADAMLAATEGHRQLR